MVSHARCATHSSFIARSAIPALALVALLGGCRSSVPLAVAPPPARAAFMPAEEPGRSYSLRDQFPGLRLQNLTFAVMPPGNSRLWYMGEREGRIVSVPTSEDATQASTVLDLRSQTLGWQDTGLLNMAFHPDFGRPGSPNRGYVYVWYNHTDKPHGGPGHPFVGSRSTNRLSRFTIADGQSRADPASELVLIEQERDNTDHQGGGMFFHPDDGFLYLGVGDGGHPYLESRGVAYNSNTEDPQHIDRDLLSGVLRIDVDCRGGSVSHPIRRQPRHGRTQGYCIPSNNPWLDHEGRVLEEFFAIGLRNPHRLTLDRVTGRIFAGDVGEGRYEEVDVIERGGNYQWSYREGNEPYAPTKPVKLLGTEHGPLHAFAHDGRFSDVIGGFVYRGRALPELGGKYLFADNGNGQVSVLDAAAAAPATATPLLRLPAEMVAYGGLASFAVDNEGELYLCVLGQNERATGSLLKLVRAAAAPAAPPTLAATGLFQRLDDLTPNEALFPYEVNAPFWSDHKQKTRWLYVPPDRRIAFRPEGDWTFPPGTVAVKHFDLALDERDPTRKRRLETRVLVLDGHGSAYGRTYKWRPDQKDAELLIAPVTERLTTIARQPFGPLESASWGDGGAGALRDDGDGKLTLTSPPRGSVYAHTAAGESFDVAASFGAVAEGAGGLMLRDGLAANGDYAMIAWEGGGEGPRALRIERRTGGAVETTRLTAVGPWLRLQRRDGTLTAYTSGDGQLWQPVAGASWRGAAGASIGLVAIGDRTAATVDVGAHVRCLARDHAYPSNDECMACHNRSTQFLLGVSTRQWNRERATPEGPVNQLVLASRRHFFDVSLREDQPAGWKKLAAIDDESAPLQDRVRSYLDANCSPCHRPGVLVQTHLDARYDTPFERQGIVRGAVRHPVVPRPNELVVVPKDLDRSRIYLKVSQMQMPPLGTLLPNQQAIELLDKWIMSLEGQPASRAVGIVASPVVGRPAMRVVLKHPDPAVHIHYTIDGSAPSEETPRYAGPFELSQSTIVRAIAFRPGYLPSKMSWQRVLVP